MTLPCQFDGSMAVPMGVPQDPMTVLLHGNGSLPSWQCKWELDTQYWHDSLWRESPWQCHENLPKHLERP